ncbi:hypothetical protein B0A81_15815 [Flavobacterium plurextorum]|uniref:Uncharacterized protein n=1 Tax=Flavobacterium plurextorum TaxID=1114867 RepID=A0ABX4CSU2_9FLAO|nr:MULTISPECIES: hypothetical protein [Flavobacterium]OXB05170.1 hypothetical protein B0A81_15815 [Flavobacterium plurextorum]OXB24148.1 hypothetical protein B0A80_05455 [Flavobacterium tructae]
MDDSNIIALVLGGIGFIISIVSLLFSPKIALKSKRLEKRLEYRFELFQKILELWEFTNQSAIKHDVRPILSEINKLIQLYGYNSEINSFKELVSFYNYYAQNQDEDSRQKLMTKFNDFFSISFNAYRKEIILEKLVD